MNLSRPTFLGFVLTLSLAACAPRAETPEPSSTPRTTTTPQPPTRTPVTPPQNDVLVLTDPAALEADRTARSAFELMGRNYAETGRYSAEVLLRDLELPTGVLWAIQEVSETSYALRVTSDSVPGVVWSVTPQGVRARQVEDDQSY